MWQDREGRQLEPDQWSEDERRRTHISGRATGCFRKLDGRWMITHERVSAPFSMDGSYRASVDLEP